MAENKVQEKKDLAAGFHFAWATDNSINKDMQGIVDSITSFSLANAHYSLFHPGNFGCWCYYCHLQHMILCKIMDRGDN